MKLDGMSTLNLLNKLIQENSDNYAWDNNTQNFLDGLFEVPEETFVDSFTSDDVVDWLDAEKGIDGFDALNLPDDEWNTFVKEYINTLL